MTPGEFKAWRKALGLSQKKAADALGLKNRIVQYYEKGERDGEKVKIPKHVRLACYALSIGISDYHGPSGEDGDGRRAKGKRKRVAREEDGAAAEAAAP
ncbi:MAG: helix-turn-helix domain-containing protein [Geminicoccaceae bacterium]